MRAKEAPSGGPGTAVLPYDLFRSVSRSRTSYGTTSSRCLEKAEADLITRGLGRRRRACTTTTHPDHQAALDVGAANSRWWAPIWAQLPGLRLVEDGRCPDSSGCDQE